MKKAIAIILAAIMLIGCLSVMAVGAASETIVTLNGKSYEAKVGDTFTYTINIKTATPIENGQFTFNFPSTVVEIGEPTFSTVIGTPMHNYNPNYSGHSVITNEFRFNFSKSSGYDLTADQFFFSVPVTVIAAGTAELRLDTIVISDTEDENAIPTTVLTESIVGLAEYVAPTEPETTEPVQPSTDVTTPEQPATQDVTDATQPATSDSGKETTTTVKKKNPIKVSVAKASKLTAKAKTLKKKSVAIKKAITYKNNKGGAVSYSITKVLKGKKKFSSKKFTINKKGTLTIKKKVTKATYKVTVKVTAKAKGNYKKYSATKTLTVKVK